MYRKTRIWLGTFETAEDAAKAYDEASRLICGGRARTNFSCCNLKEPPRKLLSATLMAKLQRCHVASLAMSKERDRNHDENINVGEDLLFSSCGREKKNINVEELKALEDDQVEQMIQELLHYGSVELSHDHS